MKFIKQSLFLRKMRCSILNTYMIIVSTLSHLKLFDHLFVTAASEPYFDSLLRLILSIRKYESDTILIYDIGLTQAQRDDLKKIHNVKIRIFQFENYPNHFDLKKTPYGSYAWKIALIYDALHSFKCSITYLDARNFAIGKFAFARYWLSRDGYYFPYTSGHVLPWTHPDMLSHFNQNMLISKSVLNGCYLSFSYSNPFTMSLVDKWMTMAMDKSIIAPEGCSRKNHRYDQSLLSCIFYEATDGQKNSPLSTKYVNIITHYDVFISKKGK